MGGCLAGFYWVQGWASSMCAVPILGPVPKLVVSSVQLVVSVAVIVSSLLVYVAGLFLRYAFCCCWPCCRCNQPSVLLTENHEPTWVYFENGTSKWATFGWQLFAQSWIHLAFALVAFCTCGKSFVLERLLSSGDGNDHERYPSCQCCLPCCIQCVATAIDCPTTCKKSCCGCRTARGRTVTLYVDSNPADPNPNPSVVASAPGNPFSAQQPPQPPFPVFPLADEHTLAHAPVPIAANRALDDKDLAQQHPIANNNSTPVAQFLNPDAPGGPTHSDA